MAGRKIIEVNYEMPFEGMMVLAGVPKYQREKIFEQLGSKELKFEFKTKKLFEVEDVHFNTPMLSRTASKLIRATSTGEIEWNPFDVEHHLAYFIKSPHKYKKGFGFAAKRTHLFDDVPHIFMLGTDKGHADLELVPDDRLWAALTSNFCKYHKLPKAV